MPGPLSFSSLPSNDPLHRALAKIGELYTATNFMTWWDARAFAVDGPAVDEWDPARREHIALLASFCDEHVLPNYRTGKHVFADHVAKVGRIGWGDVREGLLDALKHHPTAGGTRPGTAAGQFSPHAFMLLDIVEDQVAKALGVESGRSLKDAGPDSLRCARLRPKDGSAFEGTMYQHLFMVFSPRTSRLLWFDLGGQG